MRKLFVSLVVVVFMVLPVTVVAEAAWYDSLLQEAIGRSDATMNMTWYLGGKNQIRDFIMPVGANFTLKEWTGSDGTLIIRVGGMAQWPQGKSTIYGPFVTGNLKRAIAKIPKLHWLNDQASEVGLNVGYSAGNDNTDERFTVSITVVPK